MLVSVTFPFCRLHGSLMNKQIHESNMHKQIHIKQIHESNTNKFIKVIFSILNVS